MALAVVAACGGGGDGGGGGGGPLNITNTTADDGVIGSAYNDTIASTGGSGNKTFSISAGALPAGLSIGSNGAITGTPTGPAGTANFTVSVTDSAATPATDTQALSIDIVEPLAITTATLVDTSVGVAYNANVVATGGTEPYTFTVSVGSLPDGISISADGELSGTVLGSATTEDFEIEAADSSSPQMTETRGYTVRVTLGITTTALTDASGGIPYTDTLAVQGGRPPYVWSLIAGALPTGLSGPDPTTGVISGTPDAACAAATSSLTVQVEDSDSPTMTDTQAGVELLVTVPGLSIDTAALPNATLNAAYDQQLRAVGGVPPYSFAITSGSLPNQLAIAVDGRITGTPDTAETQSFNVRVTDTCPNTAVRTLSITVSAALGRNDSIADATVLPGNGTYSASISPSGHPNTLLDPDEDYYSITTASASTVTVDINGDVNGSPLDSVIEIVAANGVQLNTCGAPIFNTACEDDDETPGVDLDSFLQIQVGAGITFYIHVVDWGSNARPDKLYDLVISGVN
jgi:hypothetical protein